MYMGSSAIHSRGLGFNPCSMKYFLEYRNLHLCIIKTLNNSSEKYHQMIVDHPINGLLDYVTHEQGSKSVTKALANHCTITGKQLSLVCDPILGGKKTK